MLEKLCPIMPSRSIEETERFYAALKFKTVYKDDAPGYLLMKRDSAEIHFFYSANHRPEKSDHGAYMRPSDVDAFSAEVEKLELAREKTFPKFWPAEDKPWGMREATLWDPDGNLIRAGQEIPNWPK
jgi:catechol 2,3-dioxygenase-like lactoylglutathione lyase family enzyme